jgi:hypothetical protein
MSNRCLELLHYNALGAQLTLLAIALCHSLTIPNFANTDTR